jgi:hypothetical protein
MAGFLVILLSSVLAAALLSRMVHFRLLIGLVVTLSVVLRMDRVNPIAAVHMLEGIWDAPRTPDSKVISPDVRAAVAAVGPAVGDHCFFTMTSEGVWYYLLGRPSCSRFHQVVYARTRSAQAEVVSALAGRQPPVVLLSNSFWTQSIDGVPLIASSPLIFGFVFQNYHPLMRVAGNEFWQLGRPEFLELTAAIADLPQLMVLAGGRTSLVGTLPASSRRLTSACLVADDAHRILACANRVSEESVRTGWSIDLPFDHSGLWAGSMSLWTWFEGDAGFRRYGSSFRLGEL